MSDDEDNFQLYGTLLEPYEEDEVPKKKAFSIEDQIATDDQGRRRFHGAFTGGFSAGFFNTVGSLEGWNPSEFKSSRSEKAEKRLQKPQDFMDDEDIGQFGIAPSVVRATSDFSNIVKNNKRTLKSDGPIPGIPVLHSILQPSKETVGIRLLKKMGWKPGQGVGPRLSKTEKKRVNKENKINSGKVYGCEIPQEFRKPIELENESSDDDDDSEITFAPDDYDTFLIKPKDNAFGMGYTGLDKRPILSSHINLFAPSEFKMQDHKNNKISISGQAFGVGAFEHEDEDIYAGEDMSKYDFELESIGKKKKKKSEKMVKAKENIIEGFILAKNSIVTKKSFPPPVLPKNFIPKHGVRISRFEPLSESHKMYNYDRNKNTGRHDLTSEQRSKILNTSSDIIKSLKTPNTELVSKILETSVEKEKETLKEKAAKITNVLLPTTTVGPFKPFMTNPDKQKRYEEYLAFVKIGQEDKLSDIQPISMSEQEKNHEKYEFAQASRMFKPVTGLVFDKFVTASSTEDSTDPLKLVGKSVYEHGTQEMREAAKKKMFGQLTRFIEVWKPNKLLCKRFNVPDPDISEAELSIARRKKSKYSVFDYYEAYQQNKHVKEGPQQKNIEETKKSEENIIKLNADTTKLVEETNPALARNISLNTSDNKKAQSEEPSKMNTSCISDVNMLSNKINPVSTSSLNPILEREKSIPKEMLTTSKTSQNQVIPSVSHSSTKTKEKNKDPPPLLIPTDPKEKRDLFKAIFLSSSDESEDEKIAESPKNPNEKIIEMKKILLEEQAETSNKTTAIPKSNKGIFADLDWSKINKNKSIDVNKNTKNEHNTVEKPAREHENLFGPKLPSQIPKQIATDAPWKPVFTNKKSVEVSSSSDNEWMEIDSSVDSTNKKLVKKHKKHKSKHKKHKSKHKKKKHSDRH